MSAILMEFRQGKSVKVSVEGVHGADCKTLARPFIEIVAGKVTAMQDTHEADLPPLPVSNQVTVGH